MLIPILLFLLGLVLLIKGGDWFVDGASGIAKRFGVPDLLIGATVVSIGTTLPEVMVSAKAAWGGNGGIAYGNAIGSIICNTALIAALTIAIRPAKAQRRTLILPLSFFFVAAAIYVLTAYTTGVFTRAVGIVLLLLFVAYIITTVMQMKKSAGGNLSQTPADLTDAPAEKPARTCLDILRLIVGAVLIAVGASLLVDNGIIIAQKLGVPASVIGLTFVALGTSLPELVTAITALAKGHGALSLGNIIGANLFNLVLVSGVATTISPFSLPAEQTVTIGGNAVNASLVIDIPVMLCVMLLLALPALLREKLYRWQGIVLLGIYALFCALQFIL